MHKKLNLIDIRIAVIPYALDMLIIFTYQTPQFIRITIIIIVLRLIELVQ